MTFKATSDNMQFRAVNSVLNDRKNYTMDDFDRVQTDYASERAALIAEKKDHELWMMKRKADRAKMNAGMGKARHPLSMQTVQKWETERKNRFSRITEIDKRLQALKVERFSHLNDERASGSYPNAFLKAAKATLPGDIFDRINAAAIAYLAHEDQVLRQSDRPT